MYYTIMKVKYAMLYICKIKIANAHVQASS